MSVLGLKIEYYVGAAKSPEPVFRSLKFAFERAGAEMAQVGRYMFPRVITVLEKETSRQFDARGQGPVSGGWAPLSKSYAEWKEAHYPGKPIMERTGALRNALTNANAAYADRSFTNIVLNFGTAGLSYPSYAQTGTSRMVARPPFDFGDAANDALTEAARAGAMEAIRKAKLDALVNTTGGAS